jgi:transitional endoplasmic reticulum ATPase
MALKNGSEMSMLESAVERAFALATTLTPVEGAPAFDEDEMLSAFTLRVAEMAGKDIGYNIARVPQELWDMLYAEPDDAVELRGPHRSTAALLRLTHDEIGPKTAIRLDALQRRNAGVSIGDRVTVRKIDCAGAEHISVALVSSEAIQIDLSPCLGDLIAGALAVSHKPLCRGDVFVVPGVSHRGKLIPLVVLSTTPDGFVQAHGETTVSMSDETVPERKVAIRRKRT